MDDVRHAALRQLLVKRGYILGQGKAGFGKLPREKLIKLILLNIDTVAVFGVLTNNTQGNHSDTVFRQLLIAQIAGGIRNDYGFAFLRHFSSSLIYVFQ